MAANDTAPGITLALEAMVEEFRIESAVSPIEINAGLCADFADAFTSAFGRGTEILGTDDLFTEARSGSERLKAAVPPPGLTWDDLDVLGAVEGLSHSWIAYDGRHFDAELTRGAASPFDLPCIRHGLHELMEMREPVLLEALVSEHAWWHETQKIREEREPLLCHGFDEHDHPARCH
jgi:hypothetical protein